MLATVMIEMFHGLIGARLLSLMDLFSFFLNAFQIIKKSILILSLDCGLCLSDCYNIDICFVRCKIEKL